MPRNLILLAAVIAIAACNSTPVPTASPNPSPSGIASPIPSPIPSPTPTASPSASPSPSPTASVITEQIGLLSVTHPVAWRLVAGPTEIPGRPIPLFYLSDAPLTVAPCPTPDPKTGAFQACPPPLAALPAGGVLVTVDPNLGLPAINPPQVGVATATAPCQAIGGEAEMSSVVGGTVVRACLRGPDLAAHEAEVRAVIASLKPAP
jgi:putative hemolysin